MLIKAAIKYLVDALAHPRAVVPTLYVEAAYQSWNAAVEDIRITEAGAMLSFNESFLPDPDEVDGEARVPVGILKELVTAAEGWHAHAVRAGRETGIIMNEETRQAFDRALTELNHALNTGREILNEKEN